MLITSINTLACADDQFLRSSKPVLNSASGTDSAPSRLQTVQVLPFVTSVNTTLVSNGISFNQLVESALGAGAISVISKGLSISYSTSTTHADLKGMGSIGSDGLSRGNLNQQREHPVDASTIVSTFGPKFVAPLVSPDGNRGTIDLPLKAADAFPAKLVQSPVVDLSQTPLGMPTVGAGLAAEKRMPFTMDSAPKIWAVDSMLLHTINEAFISASLATDKAQSMIPSAAPLSLGNRTELMPIHNDLDSRITVSGVADFASISFLIRAAALSDQGGVPAGAIFVSENARSILSMNFLLNKQEMELLPLFMTEVTNLPSGDLQIRLTGIAVMENQAAPGTLILGG